MRELLAEQARSEAAQKDTATPDDTQAAADAAALAAQQAQGTNNVTNDTVVKGTTDTGSTGAIDGSKPGALGDNNQPILSDANSGLPANDNANVAAAVMNDVSAAFDDMSGAIDMAYAKVIHDCKSNIEDLENKIKDMTQKIKELKAEADKIMKIADKMEQLLPEIMAHVGTDQGNICNNAAEHSQANKEFADLLAAKIKEATGIDVDPAKMMDISEAIMRGGPGATALAMVICMQICELSADKELNGNKGNKVDAPVDPNADPADADLSADPTGGVDPTKQGLATSETLVVGDPTSDPAAMSELTGVAPGEAGDPFLDVAETPDTSATGTTGSDAAPAVDPTTGEPVVPMTPGEAFVAKLEDIAKYAKVYAEAEPYGQMWASNGEVESFNEANAALIMALFPGMGTGPNAYKIGNDFKTGQDKNGNGGVQVEGFSISQEQLAVASMMPGSMAGAFLSGCIKEQAAAKLAQIDKAIDALKAEIAAAKKEIKAINAEIGELEKKRDKEKDVVAKAKAKAQAEAAKLAEQMKNSEQSAQKGLLATFNDAVAGIFNQTVETVVEIAKEDDSLTAKGTTSIR